MTQSLLGGAPIALTVPEGANSSPRDPMVARDDQLFDACIDCGDRKD